MKSSKISVTTAGRLGHCKKDCKMDMQMALWDPKKPRFGPGLGVAPLKPIADIIAGMASRNEGEGAWHAPTKESRGGYSQEMVVGGRRRPGRDEKTAAGTERYEVTHRVAASSSEKQRTSIHIHRDEFGKEEVTGEIGHVKGGTNIGKGEEKVGCGFEDMEAEVGSDGGPDENVTRIDLKEKPKPVIILDTLSPERLGPKNPTEEQVISLDVNIGPDEISKCRRAIQGGLDTHASYSGLGSPSQPTNMGLVIWKPRERPKVKSHTPYYVVFPEENEDESTDLGKGATMVTGGDTNEMLAMFGERLKIKRMREELEDDGNQEPTMKKLLLTIGPGEVSLTEEKKKLQENKMVAANADDAGVAGLVLPQLGP